MSAVANTLLKAPKYSKDIITALLDDQLCAKLLLKGCHQCPLTEQPNHNLYTCKWFSIQRDESMDNRGTEKLMVVVRIVFSDFTMRETFLSLLPLKTTTNAVDIYDAM